MNKTKTVRQSSRVSLILILLLFPGLLFPAVKAFLLDGSSLDSLSNQITFPGINADIALNLSVMKQLDSCLPGQVHHSVLQGSDISLTRLSSRIQNLRLKETDTLFLAVSSPGGTLSGRPYFLGWKNEVIFFDDLRKIIKSSEAGLKIVLVDNSSRYVTDNPQLIRLPQPDSLSPAQLHDLFLKEKGLVFLSSGSEGETAWSTPQGSFFFNNLWLDVWQTNRTHTWETLFLACRLFTEQDYYHLWKSILGATPSNSWLNIQKSPGQHVKSWSMSAPTTNHTWQLPYPDKSPVRHTLSIQNHSDQILTIWWDKNSIPDVFDYQPLLVKKIRLKPGRSVKLKQNLSQFTIGITGQDQIYSLEPGTYQADYDPTEKVVISKQADSTVPVSWTSPGHYLWLDAQNRDIFSPSIYSIRFLQNQTLETFDSRGTTVHSGQYKVFKDSQGVYYQNWQLQRASQSRDYQVKLKEFDPGWYRLELSQVSSPDKTWASVFLLRMQAYPARYTPESSLQTGIRSYLPLLGPESGTVFRDRHPNQVLSGLILSMDAMLNSIQPLYRPVNSAWDLGAAYTGPVQGTPLSNRTILSREGWFISGIRIHRSLWSDRPVISHLEIIWQAWDKGPINHWEISRYVGNTPLWDDNWDIIKIPRGNVTVGIWGRSSDIVHDLSLVSAPAQLQPSQQNKAEK